jgi:Ser/Thr protein kinase RdoA (MazF antagonist)
MSSSRQTAQAVLKQYGIEGAQVTPLGRGLINQTFLVMAADGERRVLQRQSAIFPAEINRDIDIVTRHLAAKGLTTFELVPARDGQLWVHEAGADWRVLTFVDGHSHDALENPAQAREAGRLLAQFHAAVSDLEHRFANPRLGVHDTARHLQNLRNALALHTEHPQFVDVQTIGQEILASAAALPKLPDLPDRIVHGDPKINNILYARDADRAICLIDFDTVARMPLPLELGDALRSWCNPAGEDDRQTTFSAELFAPAVEGYASEANGWITAREIGAFVDATLTILIELASRFCADALNESYFGWDPQRFASRSEHNQVRAIGQIRAAQSLLAQRDELTRIIERTF